MAIFALLLFEQNAYRPLYAKVSRTIQPSKCYGRFEIFVLESVSSLTLINRGGGGILGKFPYNSRQVPLQLYRLK